MRIHDEDEAKKLNAEQWQTDLLKLNPSYVHWGPHEDYMCKEGSGWDSRVIKNNWKDFQWQLDDLNECVNFYFSVIRDAKECPTCGGNGYHADAQNIVHYFYNGIAWRNKITQDEVQALIDANRLGDFTRGKPKGYIPTADEVNAAQNTKGYFGHDAINRWILISARLKRLGIPEKCNECLGDGSVFTAPHAHVTLTLWMLHPRKGCSRGVEVSLIEQDDLPSVFAWLRLAAERNAERFSKLPGA